MYMYQQILILKWTCFFGVVDLLCLLFVIVLKGSFIRRGSVEDLEEYEEEEYAEEEHEIDVHAYEGVDDFFDCESG